MVIHGLILTSRLSWDPPVGLGQSQIWTTFHSHAQLHSLSCFTECCIRDGDEISVSGFYPWMQQAEGPARVIDTVHLQLPRTLDFLATVKGWVLEYLSWMSSPCLHWCPPPPNHLNPTEPKKLRPLRLRNQMVLSNSSFLPTALLASRVRPEVREQ